MRPGAGRYNALVKTSMLRWDFEERPPSLVETIRNPLAFAWAVGYSGDEWGRKRYGAFHAQLASEIRSALLVSVVVPRGHAKTTLISHIMMAWELVRDAGGRHRLLAASATLGLAKENCGKVREILGGEIEVWPAGAAPEEGQRLPLASIFPWAAPVNPLNSVGPCPSFNVAGRSGHGKEPSVFTGSPGTGLAGRRFTGAVLDDITNEQNSGTREQREKVIAFIAQIEALRYDHDHTWIRAPSTPWAPGDSTIHLSERRGWRQIKHDMYLDGMPRRSVPGEHRATVCPAFVSPEEAAEMERTAVLAGRYAFFSAQYRLQPIASDQPLFTAESWGQAHRPGLMRSSVERLGQVVLLWDPNSNVENAGGSFDRNGVAVIRIIPAHKLPYAVHDPRRNVFVPIFTGEIAGGADDALAQIEAWVGERRWPDLRSIWIEDVAAQTFLAPWARERGKIEGVRVRGQRIPAKSLTLRLAGLQTAMREGQFLIPDDLEGGDLLRERLLSYPAADYDDLPAALCLLSYHWDRIGPVEEGPEGPPPPPRELAPWSTGNNAGPGINVF